MTRNDLIVRIRNFASLCLFLGIIATTSAVGYLIGFNRGVQTGRNEIITMAVRHRHAHWEIDRDGVAKLIWRYVQDAYNGPAVQYTNDKHETAEEGE